MAKGSIVDYLKGQGQDSSYNARKKLAEQHGISNYSGTAAQNTSLLRQLQSGSGGVQSGQTEQKSTTGTTPRSDAGAPPSAPSASQTTTASGTNNYINQRAAYTPGSQVKKYQSIVKDYEGNEPDAFTSRYDGQIQNILNGILNRKDFSYDMNNDQMYQQYRDAYMRQGQQAMRDTMGAASALTGGYGSTYAQTAGSQAYDQYLAALNDKVPELEQNAYNRYLNEGNEMYNRLNALQGLDDTDYSRYRDTVNDYYTNRDYYNNRYNQEYGYDYGRYQDDLTQDNWETQFRYQQDQDALAQRNWQTQFDYQKEQDAIQNALAQQKLAASLSKSSSGGSGSSKKNSSKASSGYTKTDYVRLAKSLLNETDDNNEYVYDSGAVFGILRDLYGLTDSGEIQSIIKSAAGGGKTGDAYAENAIKSASSNRDWAAYFEKQEREKKELKKKNGGK